MIKIEVVAYNLENAINAANKGAHRIELCASPDEGGTTPSFGTISLVKKNLTIPVHVMICPRGGNFTYTDSEFESMKVDVEICKKLKIDGIVFGILTNKNTVDKRRCRELVELAKPLTSSFHRAFDLCNEPFKALEDIVDCGFQRILTSGKEKVAIDGCELLAELVKIAGDRIIIMPGGGVRKENIIDLVNQTKANEFHTSSVDDLNSILNSLEILYKR